MLLRHLAGQLQLQHTWQTRHCHAFSPKLFPHHGSVSNRLLGLTDLSAETAKRIQFKMFCEISELSLTARMTIDDVTTFLKPVSSGFREDPEDPALVCLLSMSDVMCCV
jgi:hypothetical protein